MSRIEVNFKKQIFKGRIIWDRYNYGEGWKKDNAWNMDAVMETKRNHDSEIEERTYCLARMTSVSRYKECYRMCAKQEQESQFSGI